MDNPYDYKYNGKELQDELGLNWYDYGMRMYSPALGRWNAIDPLAEKYHPLSSYSYAANSPIMLKDIEGMDIIGANGKKLVTSIDENGKLNFADGQANSKRNQGAIKILNEMAKTPQGRIALQKLIDSNTESEFSLVKSAIEGKTFGKNKGGKSLWLKFGQTTPGKIVFDSDGNVFFKKALIEVFESSFAIANGDNSSIKSRFLKKLDVLKTGKTKAFSDFGEFLNAVGVHEGGHPEGDILTAINGLLSDGEGEGTEVNGITLTGDAAKSFFKAIKKELKSDRHTENREKKPNKDENKSRSQY